MDRQKLLDRIEAVEGRKHKMYMLEGIPHIGIGHNIISRSLCDETLDFLDIEDESELMTAELNDAQCDFLLGKDFDIAVADARSIIGEDTFDGLSDARQDVLIDMSFNLGRPRFSNFAKMIAAVRTGDFDEAANQILDSKAARDPLTKNRYENLAKEMRSETPTIAETPVKTTEEFLAEIPTENLLAELNRRIEAQKKANGI